MALIPTNNARPTEIPYIPQQILPNYNRYEALLNFPPTAQQFDGDMNAIIDFINILANAVNETVAGILPGSNDPENANKLPTTDGDGNISWTFVTALNLEPNAVPTAAIQDAAVTTSKIQIGGVGTQQLADLGVTTQKIGTAAITGPKLAASSVGLANLTPGLVQFLVPVGVVFPYGGSVAPAGYMLCSGQALSRVTYASLFAAIGTAYGAGDGATTFNIPDNRGRMIAGINAGSTGNRITTATVNAVALGGVGGFEQSNLANQNNLPPLATLASYVGKVSAVPNITVSAGNDYSLPQLDTFNGGSIGFNTISPLLLMSVIIKVV